MTSGDLKWKKRAGFKISRALSASATAARGLVWEAHTWLAQGLNALGLARPRRECVLRYEWRILSLGWHWLCARSGEYQNRFCTVSLPLPYATSANDGQPPCLHTAGTGKLRHKAAKWPAQGHLVIRPETRSQPGSNLMKENSPLYD